MKTNNLFLQLSLLGMAACSPTASGHDVPNSSEVRQALTGDSEQARAFIPEYLSALRRSPFYGNTALGTASADSRGAVDGLLESIRGKGDGFYSNLSQEIEQAVCHGGFGDEELVFLGVFLWRFPKATTSPALDCMIANRGEDLVVWQSLDAWKTSGLPKSRAVEELAGRARHQNTKNRLLPQSDFLALKMLRRQSPPDNVIIANVANEVPHFGDN